MIDLIFRRVCLHCLLTLNRKEPLDLCPICKSRLDQRKSMSAWSTLMAERLPFSSSLRHCKTMVSMSGEDEMHSLIHSLKYRFMGKLGVQLGKELGSDLQEFLAPDQLLIPIPVHKKRLYQRGYNQAVKICNGINQALPYSLPIISGRRNSYTLTQTKLGRGSRSENVEGIFSILEPDQIANKDVWIIDDVLTTGATLHEMCKTVFLCQPKSMSVATLAITV